MSGSRRNAFATSLVACALSGCSMLFAVDDFEGEGERSAPVDASLPDGGDSSAPLDERDGGPPDGGPLACTGSPITFDDGAPVEVFQEPGATARVEPGGVDGGKGLAVELIADGGQRQAFLKLPVVDGPGDLVFCAQFKVTVARSGGVGLGPRLLAWDGDPAENASFITRFGTNSLTFDTTSARAICPGECSPVAIGGAFRLEPDRWHEIVMRFEAVAGRSAPPYGRVDVRVDGETASAELGVSLADTKKRLFRLGFFSGGDVRAVFDDVILGR